MTYPIHVVEYPWRTEEDDPEQEWDEEYEETYHA
jgi:hypothetical protein